MMSVPLVAAPRHEGGAPVSHAVLGPPLGRERRALGKDWVKPGGQSASSPTQAAGHLRVIDSPSAGEQQGSHVRHVTRLAQALSTNLVGY